MLMGVGAHRQALERLRKQLVSDEAALAAGLHVLEGVVDVESRRPAPRN